MSQCCEKLTLLDTTFYCVLPKEHQCKHEYKFLQSDVELFVRRAERAEKDLAAAQALLRRMREDCNLDMRLWQWHAAIDAALAGEDATLQTRVAELEVEISARRDLMQGYLDCWRNDKARAERAEADLAAVRALLREVLDCDQQAIPDWLANDINAALAGDKP